jgi:hypothetical protein
MKKKSFYKASSVLLVSFILASCALRTTDVRSSSVPTSSSTSSSDQSASSTSSSSSSSSSVGSSSVGDQKSFDADVYFGSAESGTWDDDQNGYWTQGVRYGYSKSIDQMPYFMALDAMPSNALAPNPQTYEDAWMTYDGKWGCHFPESENYIVYVDSFKWMATEKFPYSDETKTSLEGGYVRQLDNYIAETQRFAKGLGEEMTKSAEDGRSHYPSGTHAYSINRIDLASKEVQEEWSSCIDDGVSGANAKIHNMAIDWTQADAYKKVILNSTSQYFVFKREGGWSSAGKWVLKDYVQDQMYADVKTTYHTFVADVKASSVYQALPDDKKSYDLPNVLLVDNGISVRKTELTEAVGRTLPWSYDGLI